MIKNLLRKTYEKEIHIFDGIISTIILVLFVSVNQNIIGLIKSTDLLFILSFLALTILVMTITIRYSIIEINNIQISIAMMILLIFLGVNSIYSGIFAFWIFTCYEVVFFYIFARNLLIKSYKLKGHNLIRW